MPSFGQLPRTDVRAVIAYLLDLKSAGSTTGLRSVREPAGGPPPSPYRMTGYVKLRTPEGYPASRPPWGTLTAINLNTGKTLWQVPLGTYPKLVRQGLPPTGTENYGGAVVTAGGLLFIAATLDGRIRAFDKASGRLLWEAPLPAAGFATPITYTMRGKQFVVIAAGGGKLGVRSGDSYVAFALP